MPGVWLPLLFRDVGSCSFDTSQRGVAEFRSRVPAKPRYSGAVSWLILYCMAIVVLDFFINALTKSVHEFITSESAFPTTLMPDRPIGKCLGTHPREDCTVIDRTRLLSVDKQDTRLAPCQACVCARQVPFFWLYDIQYVLTESRLFLPSLPAVGSHISLSTTASMRSRLVRWCPTWRTKDSSLAQFPRQSSLSTQWDSGDGN